MNPVVMFWVAVGVLLALTIAILSWPLLRTRTGAPTSRVSINAAIYRDEMAELEKDREIGSLSEEDYGQAREELERRVLEDTSGSDTAPVAEKPAGLPRTAIALLVLLPLFSLPLYFYLGTPAGINPEVAERAEQGQGGHGGKGGPSMADLDKMATALAEKLAKNPDNPQGWLMLGRSYKALGRYDEAEKAYAKVPNMDSDPALILEQVDLAAYKGNGKIEGKALTLLNQMLKADPDNPQALVLAGTGAFYRADYASAITYWQRLMTQVQPGSEDAKNLANGIAEAKARLNGGGAMGGEKPAAPEPSLDAKPAAQGVGVSGEVTLGAAIKSKAAPEDTVFVFAKALEGPKMPLAVVRAKVSELPLRFNLDDSTAMSPELRVSNFKEVRIEARISKSGDAIAKPGDLMGVAGPVKPGAKGVKVVVDKVLP